MNRAKLRSKRVIVTTAAAAALAVGGGVWATTAAYADTDLQGADRDRVGNAAVQAVGGGTVLDVEAEDGRNQGYEVEVRKPDGTEVDVTLDKDLKVTAQQAETPDAAGEDTGDRALTDAERASAEKAAREAVSGGTVLEVEAGAEPGVAYDVEVRAADGSEWDVQLDTAFKVLAKNADD